MKYRFDRLIVFVASDGRELWKSRMRAPRRDELIATTERIWRVLGQHGRRVMVTGEL